MACRLSRNLVDRTISAERGLLLESHPLIQNGENVTKKENHLETAALLRRHGG